MIKIAVGKILECHLVAFGLSIRLWIMTLADLTNFILSEAPGLADCYLAIFIDGEKTLCSCLGSEGYDKLTTATGINTNPKSGQLSIPPEVGGVTGSHFIRLLFAWFCDWLFVVHSPVDVHLCNLQGVTLFPMSNH